MGLEGLSESLRRELMMYGIDVVIISGFMAGGARDGLPVVRVGALIHHALTVKRPRVRYALAPNLLFDWIVPRRWVIFARRLDLERAR
jgi:hypothetical protein